MLCSTRRANCSGLLGKKTLENEILREALARGDPMCQRVCLTGAGAGDNQKRAGNLPAIEGMVAGVRATVQRPHSTTLWATFDDTQSGLSGGERHIEGGDRLHQTGTLAKRCGHGSGCADGDRNDHSGPALAEVRRLPSQRRPPGAVPALYCGRCVPGLPHRSASQ